MHLEDGPDSPALRFSLMNIILTWRESKKISCVHFLFTYLPLLLQNKNVPVTLNASIASMPGVYPILDFWAGLVKVDGRNGSGSFSTGL